MTKEEIIGLMRSGALRLIVRNAVVEGENQPGITMSGDADVFSADFLQSFQRYQFDFLLMLMRSDVRVCLSPDEHQSEYRFRIDTSGKVRMCLLCQEKRAEESRKLPPIEDCIQLVNMQPI